MGRQQKKPAGAAGRGGLLLDKTGAADQRPVSMVLGVGEKARAFRSGCIADIVDRTAQTPADRLQHLLVTVFCAAQSTPHCTRHRRRSAFTPTHF